MLALSLHCFLDTIHMRNCRLGSDDSGSMGPVTRKDGDELCILSRSEDRLVSISHDGGGSTC